MEALISRPAASGTLPTHLDNYSTQDEQDEILPPAPAPFPTEALYEADRNQSSVLDANFDALQQSCIQALAFILDQTPQSSSSSTSTALSPTDAQLASALTALLEVSYELETYRPSTSSNLSRLTDMSSSEGGDLSTLQSLTRQITHLQDLAQHRSTVTAVAPNRPYLHPAITIVREELAWLRVETLSRSILEMIERRAQPQLREGDDHRLSVDELPSYSRLDGMNELDSETASLPEYQDVGPSSSTTRADYSAATKESVPTHHLDNSFPHAPEEKLFQDLDVVTDAIERLQAVSPRLHEQCSEFRQRPQSKEQIQARMHRDKMRELEGIWEKIERTHGNRGMLRNGQRVDAREIQAARTARRKRFFESLIAYGEEARLEDQDSSMRVPDHGHVEELKNGDHANSSQRSLQQSDDSKNLNQDGEHTSKSDFVADVIKSSQAGRMHNQDSHPPTPKILVEDSRELVTMADFFKDGRGPMTTKGANGHGVEAQDLSTALPSEDDEGKKSQGTLKKIAGMVRSRSLSRGLKGSSNDLSSLTYVAEHQEYLRAVQIMIHGSGLCLKEEMTIETDNTSIPGCPVDRATVVSKRDPPVKLRICLPTAVLAGQVKPLGVQDLHLETKLSAIATAASAPINSLNTHLTYALSASQLRELRPKALCCTVCDREIADLGRTLKNEIRSEGSGFKDLPSEHWGEMTEVWMCHDSPAFTAKLAQTIKEGFWPTRETVLVGGSYLLVNGEEVKRSCIVVESSDADTWEVVRCACGEVLGKKRTDNGQPGAGDVRFSKWAIALLRQDNEEAESVEPIRFPLSVFIMSDLLELAQAHATYRFVIKDEKSDSDRILIWLFNPSMKISYRSALGVASLPPSPIRKSQSQSQSRNRSSSKSNSRRSSNASSTTINQERNSWIPTAIRAAKVLYKLIEPPEPSNCDINGFGQNTQVEHVAYPPDVVERLITALKESTAVYPITRRSLSGYQVGFLERV